MQPILYVVLRFQKRNIVQHQVALVLQCNDRFIIQQRFFIDYHRYDVGADLSQGTTFKHAEARLLAFDSVKPSYSRFLSTSRLRKLHQ